MLERLASPEALKELIRDFAYPVVVTRGPMVVAVNEAWLSFMGYGRDQIEGRPYVEFMPPEERARITQRAELRAKNPGSIPFVPMTSLALKADGRSTIVHVAPTAIPARDGEPFVLNLIFVLPERDAEIELAELLVATSSHLAGARTVPDVRRAAVSHLGAGGYAVAFFEPDGSAIHPVGSSLPPHTRREDVDEAIAEARAVFVGPETGTPSAVIVPIRRGKESELMALAGPRLGTPLLAALKLFAQGVGSALDTASLIVDLERRNHELSETRAELVRRERLAALGEMAASIAHEVRNPVGVISNAVTTLRREDAQFDRGELLEIVDEECLRLARMVQDLLDFANPRRVSFTLEALAEIAEEAIAAASVHPDPALRSVRFELDGTPDVPRVSVDRNLLRQALVNLLINAAQASPDDGVVRVYVGLTDAGGGRRPSVSVVDHGCGIAAPIADRIFEPFFTTRAQGTGLGLAVVRRIVEELRGEIFVETSRGRGATFTLAFTA
jgi:PAS domain S-box-containing protein